VSPAPARIEDRLTWLLSRNYARSAALLQDGFAAGGGGLRSTHYRLLAAIEEWGPASQADLSRSTGLDRSDVVGLLGELEGQGLVKRRVDPANKRRNIVSITAAGKRKLAALDKVLDAVQEQVATPLSESEERQLRKLLRKLLDA
jgi:DNA-binding MarR family transcriptional regulator